MALIYANAHDSVAHLDAVKAAVRAVADEGAARARILLEEHRETGNASIEVETFVTDTVVSLVDPAALSIEFGRPRKLGRPGFMEGLHIIGRAFGV